MRLAPSPVAEKIAGRAAYPARIVDGRVASSTLDRERAVRIAVRTETSPGINRHYPSNRRKSLVRSIAQAVAI